ncbi:MAG TPA: ATP-dependent helicase [Verrucomicrobiales bacterium]|nr:ATP-dependent helicase [Verrucomicrobiales bacterium]
MPDLIHVQYATTGASTSIDALGMREMQARAYTAREAQYLLLKAPPASGKSRALMFIALDKLNHQGLRKAIIAVPERSIGGSFDSTPLSQYGFYADWTVPPQHNLCTPGGDQGKVGAFKAFMEGDGRILICTHATLRCAFNELESAAFNGCLLAVDEFHHVSGNEDSRLGELVRGIMAGSDAHLVAMTGSYFRGDSQPVLLPEDEAKFIPVTYNYYEQLNGYEHLKSLGIGYHFYQGRYLTAIGEVLDTDKKTIVHIPSPNAGESTKDKIAEVNAIMDLIGEVTFTDTETGIHHIKRKTDNKIIKVADLVYDEKVTRTGVIEYLRTMKEADDLDLIIALGMAKEGFDWKFCEHALTVGYRGSLTEVIQIIGRCTRDCAGKTHAQFTNLIAKPDAKDGAVAVSVNNMLKAITCSLLMEQVLAPVIKFKPKRDDEDTPKGELRIKGLKGVSTDRVKKIIEQDINDLKAAILSDDSVTKAVAGVVDPEVLNKILIPKVIETKYPQLTAEEKEQVRQHVVVDSAIRGGEISEQGDQRFIRMAGRFINIDDLSIDLIDSINPFQRAYEILSKQVNVPTLKAIQDCIAATRIQMSDEEALLLWPKIKAFVQQRNHEPNLNSPDPLEQRMASALIFIKKLRQQRGK